MLEDGQEINSLEQGEQATPAIVPHTEKVVSFYGDDIPVAQLVDEEIYVPIRALTTFLGLSFGSQRNRILRDDVMAARIRQVQMSAVDGRQLAMLCLPLDLLPGWLFGITTSKIRPELQEKLKRYRAEGFRVLWDAFKANVTSAAVPQATGLSSAEQTLEMAAVVYNLAQQQVEFERQLSDVATAQAADRDRLGKMADYMRGFIQQTNARLSSLELRLDPAAAITDEQAAEIALAVKNVAHAMDEHGTAGSYGKVYSELYRRYRISSYKNLPRARYDEVLGWLSRWYDEVVGKDKVKG